MAEHCGISARTGNALRSLSSSSVREHCQSHRHTVDSTNFRIISSVSSDYDLSIFEGLLITRDLPNLNTVEQSGDLRLFR